MLRRATLLLSLATASQGAAVIDRVAVIVENHVVTLSDVDRDLRLTEFLNREQPDFSSGNRRKAAERLIDQTIIRDEIARGGYRRATDSDADGLLKQLRRDRFEDSDSRLREALGRYGLTEDQLRAQLLWQLTVIRFIDQRFRPGVLLADEEVRAYYDQHRDELQREYPKNSSFDALESKIRSSLEGKRINQYFMEWLDQSRKRNRIEYREGAFP
jgi:parvulin-like peptidyl-prolyl isomerase